MHNTQFGGGNEPEGQAVKPRRRLDASGNSIEGGRLDAPGNAPLNPRLDASGNSISRPISVRPPN